MSEDKKDALITADLQQKMTKAIYMYDKENDIEPKHVILALSRMLHQQSVKLFGDEWEC